MPQVGPVDSVKLDPGDPAKPGSGYRQRFDHKTEKASPGYYAVTLADSGIRAELTAGTRVGVHRYSFPAGKDAHLLLDLRSSLYDYPGKILWSGLRSEEHTSELQSLMRNSYAVFCLKKKKTHRHQTTIIFKL